MGWRRKEDNTLLLDAFVLLFLCTVPSTLDFSLSPSPLSIHLYSSFPASLCFIKDPCWYFLYIYSLLRPTRAFVFRHGSDFVSLSLSLCVRVFVCPSVKNTKQRGEGERHKRKSRNSQPLDGNIADRDNNRRRRRRKVAMSSLAEWTLPRRRIEKKRNYSKKQRDIFASSSVSSEC